MYPCEPYCHRSHAGADTVSHRCRRRARQDTGPNSSVTSSAAGPSKVRLLLLCIALLCGPTFNATRALLFLRLGPCCGPFDRFKPEIARPQAASPRGRRRLRPHQPSAPLSQAWSCQARPTARWARQAGASVSTWLASDGADGSVVHSPCCMHSKELRTAADAGDTKAVVALLARGADVHSKDNDGCGFPRRHPRVGWCAAVRGGRTVHSGRSCTSACSAAQVHCAALGVA